MSFEILETDKLFGDSPDTGWPECKCSRCGKQILEGDVPIRCWPTIDGDVSHYEYRFHASCIFPNTKPYDPSDDEDDYFFNPDHL